MDRQAHPSLRRTKGRAPNFQQLAKENVSKKCPSKISSEQPTSRNLLIIKQASTRIRTGDLLITNRATKVVVVRIRSEPGQLGGICLVTFDPATRAASIAPVLFLAESTSLHVLLLLTLYRETGRWEF